MFNTKGLRTVLPNVLIIAVLLLHLSLGGGEATQEDEFLHGTFPDNFQWGLCTSAYTAEGGWNEDGKGMSIWDEFTHRVPSPVFDNNTGDIACDSYHKYREDVAILKEMGVNHYRFSLSWSRILPLGTTQMINQAGVDYYNNLIDLLLENDIEPMVTLYHWDLPQALMDIGGWPNEDLVTHFTKYAELAFQLYGDRVKKWLTFNEPFIVCIMGYLWGIMAPGIQDPVKPYQCAHTILKAHAKSYRLYDSMYRQDQGGLVGITLDASWYEPKNASDPSHVAAAARAIQFNHGWFASPIFFGKYPDVMREFVDRASEEEGLPESRLPHFTLTESFEIKGTWDFLGLNHYTTELIEPALLHGPGWDNDQDLVASFDPSWPGSSAEWLKVVPWGFRKLLNWLKNTYGSPPIYVTENGYADYPETGIEDTDRASYYTSYINEMLKAVVLDKVRVQSYTAFGLMDQFEWARGYSERFGVYSVNFSDPERPRTAKNSAHLLRRIFADNGFPNATL